MLSVIFPAFHSLWCLYKHLLVSYLWIPHLCTRPCFVDRAVSRKPWRRARPPGHGWPSEHLSAPRHGDCPLEVWSRRGSPGCVARGLVAGFHSHPPGPLLRSAGCLRPSTQKTKALFLVYRGSGLTGTAVVLPQTRALCQLLLAPPAMGSLSVSPALLLRPYCFFLLHLFL